MGRIDVEGKICDSDDDGGDGDGNDDVGVRSWLFVRRRRTGHTQVLSLDRHHCGCCWCFYGEWRE